MTLLPITIREANAFVESFHRHNAPVRGGKFAIGASSDAGLIGIAIVGRPIARMLDDGYTAELLRTCTRPEAPKGAVSFLASRAWRAWQAMGGKRMVTYTLADESGASMRGAGWKLIGNVKNTSAGWSRDGRERDWQPIYGQLKLRWDIETRPNGRTQ